MTKKKDYVVKKFPGARRITADLFEAATKHHVVHGLLDFDITDIRKYIEKQKKSGKELSLTAFFVYCLAKAIDENKIMNAMRKGNKKIVIFDDVDVSVLVEVEKDWKMVPVLYIVRAANKKTYQEINNEIQELKKGKNKEYERQDKTIKFYLLFPKFIRKAFIRNRYKHNPAFRKKLGGTVSLSSVGMFSGGGGWGIPLSMFTVFALIGGISKKPLVVDDKIEIREVVDVTFTMDHSMIDGAPMARFTKAIKKLIESGHGMIK
ncbi:MAG: 2-oxo acid dehydrogenase subunit E2 [Asgard group archaeon]|nr:2-oxo acid dehydrogenase subunit E2 [Asgard group archaeon]